MDNTHEVAQRIAPDARIVYADHDPTVLVHATALLTSSPEGATAYIDADLRDPDSILEQAARTLDLTHPVALILLGVAAHVPDESAYDIVARLMDALPAGSHLVFGDSTEVYRPEAMRAMVEDWNKTSDNPRVNRSPDQLARFFDGLELLEPGLLSVAQWRAERGGSAEPWEVDCFGGAQAVGHVMHRPRREPSRPPSGPRRAPRTRCRGRQRGVRPRGGWWRRRTADHPVRALPAAGSAGRPGPW